eukprot:CAMPEP_0171071474 /NCGR_PEP_ID=MMETSP0766_2-20121228/10344_1 /TAXON_ID=439317 /ORGANISM="Gambierdiscus australes, Strain CAWD 149" /LENGTH=267 /DNA_ID=CAMNT_0011528017 /DNA_START=67 /DNA_END=870 /DNA_ORIENTATION=-
MFAGANPGEKLAPMMVRPFRKTLVELPEDVQQNVTEDEAASCAAAFDQVNICLSIVFAVLLGVAAGLATVLHLLSLENAVWVLLFAPLPIWGLLPALLHRQEARLNRDIFEPKEMKMRFALLGCCDTALAVGPTPQVWTVPFRPRPCCKTAIDMPEGLDQYVSEDDMQKCANEFAKLACVLSVHTAVRNAAFLLLCLGLYFAFETGYVWLLMICPALLWAYHPCMVEKTAQELNKEIFLPKNLKMSYGPIGCFKDGMTVIGAGGPRV